MDRIDTSKPNLKHWQRRNFLISFIFSFASLLVYFLSGTICNLSESDNVGIFIIPPMLFIIHMPLISLLLGVGETFWFKKLQSASSNTFLRDFLDTQPLILRLMSIFPIVALFLTLISKDGFFLTFPYWWLPHCF